MLPVLNVALEHFVVTTWLDPKDFYLLRIIIDESDFNHRSRLEPALEVRSQPTHFEAIIGVDRLWIFEPLEVMLNMILVSPNFKSYSRWNLAGIRGEKHLSKRRAVHNKRQFALGYRLTVWYAKPFSATKRYQQPVIRKVLISI